MKLAVFIHCILPRKWVICMKLLSVIDENCLKNENIQVFQKMFAKPTHCIFFTMSKCLTLFDVSMI